jgi:cbb3-type cytochrome oxidase subunit 3
MNKTQRRALFTVSISILLIALGVIIFNSMFTPGDKTTGVKPVKVWMWLIVAVSVGGVSFVYRKRRASEVDKDERDNYIKKNAVLVSFTSLWVLLFAVSIIPSFVAGDAGSIPVCLLPIINMGVFLLAMLVYSVVVLAQYGRTGKGEKS